LLRWTRKDRTMTLDDLLEDIYALEDDLRSYERKYGVLSETFYEAYRTGAEPAEESWVQDWAAWGSAYELWQKRHDQYRQAIQVLRSAGHTPAEMIEKTARHERIAVSA
jgi:hypothetical protein